MSFYLALPVALIATLAVSVVWQQLSVHFVDLRDLLRQALVVTLLWASVGWYVEARGAENLASVAAFCEDSVALRFTLLQMRVLRHLD